jgi:hypothetical protein
MTLLAQDSSNLTDRPSQPVEFVGELEDCCRSVAVSCCCEKLAAEAGVSSGSQREADIRRWKPLPSNGSEDVTVDIIACNCEL